MDLNETYDSSHVLNAYADSILEGLEATASRNSIHRMVDATRLARTMNVIKSNSVDLDQMASSYFTKVLNGIDAAIYNRSDKDSALNNAFSAASALSEFFEDKHVHEAGSLKSAALYLNNMVGELKSYKYHYEIE